MDCVGHDSQRAQTLLGSTSFDKRQVRCVSQLCECIVPMTPRSHPPYTTSGARTALGRVLSVEGLGSAWKHQTALVDLFESFDYSNRMAGFWMRRRIGFLAEVGHNLGKL